MQNEPKAKGTLLERWARWAVVGWKRSLLIALAVTIAAGVGISILRLDLTFYSIMPKNSQAAADLAEIVETFPSASTIVTVVSGAPETIRDAADAVAEAYGATAFAEHLSQISARIDDEFFLENGLMLLPKGQIRRLRLLLAATAARTSGRSSGASSITTLDLRQVLRTFGADGYSSFGDGTYYLNKDGTMALVFAQPTFGINDMSVYAKVIPQMERAAKQAAARYGAEAGLTGLLVVGKDEMETSEKGLEASMLVAVLLILALLIAAYRMWSVPLIVGFPLLLGVVWTAGAGGFILGRLNIMTAMYMVALVGLGVDYGIHLLTAYRQTRDTGAQRVDAVVAAFGISGRGIIIGAITTAVAFFALVVADSDLVRELGVFAGLGILCELAAMMLVVPALLGFRASRLDRRPHKTARRRGFASPGPLAAGAAPAASPRTSRALILVLGAAAVTTALATQAGKVEVENNLMNMEAKGLESVELQDVMVEEFGMAPDTLAVIAESPNEAYELTKALERLDTVSAVDSIAFYLPPPDVQDARLEEIGRLRTVLDAILADDGSPLAPLARALLPLTEDATITLDDVPDDVKATYFAPGGKRNLVTIVPEENLWIRQNRDALTAEVATVTDRATGMVLTADQMTKIAEQDGRTAALAAVITIFIVLLIDFRNLATAILTLTPLACSFLSLFGIMALTGIKFDFVNIIAVPLLIGIGIDDAVHITHRYLIEGRGSIRRTVNLTGRAILLTTLTTIIGFGSFIPSPMRAMRSTGIVLSLAMALAFLYSVLLHPALLYLFRERLGIRISPVGRGGIAGER